MDENTCPGCGQPPAWSGPGTEPGSTIYRCANGHNWEAPEPEGKE
jgi:hypothetical protein